MRFYLHNYDRIAALEGKNVRSTRFASIGSSTSGTVTLPTGATVILDDFGGTVDAVVSQISGGRPTYEPATDSAGNVIAATFDASGNWTFSGTPVAYPVALLYRVRQSVLNYDATDASIVGPIQQEDFTITWKTKRTATATNYTVLATDDLIAITSTSSARTMTLPAPSAVPGKVFCFKDESLACSLNNITLSPTSGTIDGAATFVMNIDGEAVFMYSNGTAYFVV